MPRFLCMTIAACSVITAPAFGEIREYLLGDIDDFEPGGEDDVYVDSDWLDELTNAFGWEVVAFDDPIESTGGEMTPFSFVFDLTHGETIIAASLTFRLKQNGGTPWNTDVILLDQLEPEYLLVDLPNGWDGNPSVLTINLSDVLGNDQVDLLPLLADGLLNCMVGDDSVIDYATLTLSIILGDIDDFVYEGAGSEDDVYVDPVWQSELLSAFPSWKEVDFDEAIPGASMVPFTFRFDLLSGEVVADAWLEFRLAPRGFGGGPLDTDRIYFDSVALSYLLHGDLGWNLEDSVLTLHLSDVLEEVGEQDDLRPLLQDGQLNCMIQDDSKVDYATLTLSIILDCNTNWIPDECDIDCGSDGGPCDVPGCGESDDCNTNSIPDDCEPDFDGDGLIDDCDSDIDNDSVANDVDVCDYTPWSAVERGRVIMDAQGCLYGTIRGDHDGDCDCDLEDYAEFALDFTGPGS